jgi:integrase
MSLTATTKIKDKIIEQTGLPYIRIHDLRHSHASYLIKNGANMYAVSRRLGHSSIQMTIDRYTHLLPDAQDEVLQAIDG